MYFLQYKDFVLENIFLNWTQLTPADFKTFSKNWLKLNKQHKIISEKDPDVKGDYKIYYGFIKGNKTAEWKYDQFEMKIHHDKGDKNIFKTLR